jgi:hypothetical protein
VVVGDGVRNLCVTVSRIYRKKEKTSLSFGPSSYVLRHVHGPGLLGGNSKVIIEKNIVVSALRKKKREEKEMYLGLEKCLEPLLSSPFSDLSVTPSVNVVCRRWQ